MVLVIGFVGGFLERLVPDLLEKKNPQGNGSSTTTGCAAYLKRPVKGLEPSLQPTDQLAVPSAIEGTVSGA